MGQYTDYLAVGVILRIPDLAPARDISDSRIGRRAEQIPLPPPGP